MTTTFKHHESDFDEATQSRRGQSWFGECAAVFRLEWTLLVQSPLTYIFQFGFLLTISIAIFLVADFFHSDESSVRPLLTFLPWVALVFVPALGMRACQDIDTSGELLMSLPLRLSAIICGKFLAGFSLLLITLVFTLSFPLTVIYLGDPDAGEIIASYCAAALLLGAYYAIALFASAISGQQVAAFVLGVLILFLLTIPGWDTPTRLLGEAFAGNWFETIRIVSPKTWVDALGRGVIDTVSVGYFLIVTCTALIATTWAVGTRRKFLSTVRYSISIACVSAACLFIIALFTSMLSSLPGKLDLTEENEYSLGHGTKRLVDSLHVPTEIHFYWSDSEAATPAHIKSHATRVRAILTEIQHYSKGVVSIVDTDPQPDSENELDALNDEIQKAPMTSGDYFFLGASFNQANRTTRIPYFDLDRDRLTEYDIAVAIQTLSREHIPRVGILSPLLAPGTAQKDREGLSFVSELRKAYDLAVIPYFSAELPPRLDVLILIQPVILQKKMLYAIDQYLMAGGSVIAMMDPFVRLERGVNQASFDPSIEINDLSDLAMAYGVEFDPTTVVGDQSIAAEVAKPDGSALNYPFWLRARTANLSPAHPVTVSLNELLLVESGHLITTPSADQQVQTLIQTSVDSATLPRDRFKIETPDELAEDFKKIDSDEVTDKHKLAVAVTGRFKSAFKDAGFATDEQHQHQTDSSGTPQLFVLADTDWLFDPFSLQKVSVGEQNIVRPLNDNLALLLNLIEYASGSPELLSIRSRGTVRRPFTRIEDMLSDSRLRYQQRESELIEKLKLQENESVENSDSANGPSDSERRKLQSLLPIKQELREIRQLIRSSVDQLGQRLVTLNLIAGPVLSLLFCFVARMFRRRYTRQFLHATSNEG